MPVIQIQPYGELDKKIDEYAEKWKVSRGDVVMRMIDKFVECIEKDGI